MYEQLTGTPDNFAKNIKEIVSFHAKYSKPEPVKKDNFITEVIFRKWPPNDFNLVIALFPYQIETTEGYVMSYEHIGQHGAAYYEGVINGTDPAKESEYSDLKSELESLGYNLKVIKKRNYKRYLAELTKSRKSY